MKTSKEQIHEIVEVFYQNPFKTFYINSNDGETFVKPFAIFVSLGMTTSLKSLENIRNILNNYNEFHAELAEIKSKKSIANQFLNSINNISNVNQYEIPGIPDKCFGREESLEYFPTSGIEESKWKPLFNKIDESDEGWNSCLLQILDDGEIRIYHKFVNYKKDSDGTEYRIGIYVTES